jgi:transposase-like protein
MQVVSRAMVVVIAIHALIHREGMGIAVGVSGAEGFWRQFLGLLQGARPGGDCLRCAAQRAETNRQLPISIELIVR